METLTISSTKNKVAKKFENLGVELTGHIDSYEKDYSNLLNINIDLNRQIVSFQNNKSIPLHRLFKYKEGFSASLVNYLISTLNISESILDPFSGTGTTSIFAASKGIQSTGIELLPVGHCAAQAKSLILRGLSHKQIQNITRWISEKPWTNKVGNEILTILRITDGAYTNETVEKIENFLYLCKVEEEELATVLRFALLSILESVSFTRKDGQCLRWDTRSGRTATKRPFTKNEILSFDDAMEAKLRNIVQDLKIIHTPQELFTYNSTIKLPNFICGSVLQELPLISSNSYKSIITSPPYCNRYDYTRTYALELAALGVNEAGIRSLRKTMLSCTVENQSKDLVSMNNKWQSIINYTQNHRILRDILEYLNEVKESGILNNNGIPRMIEGYFVELACVIYECYRVLQAGGVFAMVNDNVQYAGVSIPVDLILSDIASHCGFFVDRIMVLPSGKGNSSQQMGRFGRNPLRKCVYVWRK